MFSNSSIENQSADLRSAPPHWRIFLPAWVRALIWAEQSSSFAAFLSYSWRGESAIAPIIQSVIQMFLRPWYKPRALNIFRDLSSLAAGSSLQESLQQKLDQSQHLIVLASSNAATSEGMEFEANYWFSKDRDGTVLIVVTEPGALTWDDVRNLLPPSMRQHLTSPPLWVDLSAQCSRIREKPFDHDIGQITEALRQLILAFYPGRTWPELRGEERQVRRRALALVWSAIAVLSMATSVAIWKAIEATRQTAVAENRLIDLISAEGRQALMGNDYERALLFLSEAYARRPDDDALQFMSAAAIRNVARALRTNEIGERIDFLTFSPDSKRVLTVADGPSQVWISDAETGSPLVRLQTPRIAFPPRPYVETPKIKNDFTLMGAMNGPMASLFDSASYRRPFLSVLGARFFAKGTRVLTWGGELAIYDALTGRRLADFPLLQGLSWIRHAEFNRTERMLLTYDDDGAVVVWDAGSRKMLRSLAVDPNLNAEAGTFAAFDPTGHRIVVVAADSKIRIWDTERLDEPPMVLKSGTGEIIRAEFAPPDGDRLVTVSEDGPAQLWDLSRSPSEPRPLDSKSDDSVTLARFSGDGQHIVTIGGNDVGIWDGFSAELLHVLRGHTCNVDDMDLSPDSSRLLTACSTSDASARMWNVETGDLIGTFRVAEDDTPVIARFSPDGTKIATGSGFGRYSARVWPARHDMLRFEKDELKPKPDFFERSFLLDSQLTTDARAIVRMMDEVIETTSLENGKTLSRVKLPYPSNAASLSANGKAAVIARYDFKQPATFDAIDPATGRIVSGQAATIPGKIESLSFSPDGKFLAVVAQNYSPDAQVIELWETSPWKRRYAIPTSQKPSALVHEVWSPDSAFVALELGHTVLVINTTTGSTRNLPGMSPAFSADSTRLALASSSVKERDSGRVEVRLHDLRGNGKPLVLQDREHPHEDWIYDIAFNAEGTQVATGSQDQTVKLWDLRSGALLATLGEDPVIGGREQPYVTNVAYSPDGKLLASADDEGGVRIWDTRQHLLLFRMTDLYSSEALFEKFEFTPDGKSLVLVGGDWFGAFETGLSQADPAFVRAAASRLVPPHIRAVVPLGHELTSEATAKALETRTPPSSSGPPATAPTSEEFAAVTEIVPAIVQSLRELERSEGQIRVNADKRSQTKHPSMKCPELAEAEREVNHIMIFGTTVTADRLAEEQTAWTAEFRAIARQSDISAEAKRNLADRAGKLQQLLEQAATAAKLAQERVQAHVEASEHPAREDAMMIQGKREISTAAAVAGSPAKATVARGPACKQAAAALYQAVLTGSANQRLIDAARLHALLKLLRQVLSHSEATPAGGDSVRSPGKEHR